MPCKQRGWRVSYVRAKMERMKYGYARVSTLRRDHRVELLLALHRSVVFRDSVVVEAHLHLLSQVEQANKRG